MSRHTVQLHFFIPDYTVWQAHLPISLVSQKAKPVSPESILWSLYVAELYLVSLSLSLSLCLSLSLSPLTSFPSHVSQPQKQGFSTCNLEASNRQSNRIFQYQQAVLNLRSFAVGILQIITFWALIPYRLVRWHSVSGHNSFDLEEGVSMFIPKRLC